MVKRYELTPEQKRFTTDVPRDSSNPSPVQRLIAIYASVQRLAQMVRRRTNRADELCQEAKDGDS